MGKRLLSILGILVFLIILGAVSGNAESVGYCQHCRQEVTWQPLTQSSAEGHFYVSEATQTITKKTLSKNLCLDLRGNTLQTEGQQVFYLAKTAVLSIQDSVGGGKIIGSGYGDSTFGGTLSITKDAACHLYGGTLTNIPWEDAAPKNGGVVYCVGAMYMYGGAIENGICSWTGGNVYVLAGGRMEMSGGTVTGGKAGVTHTECILNRGAFSLSGDAEISEMRLFPNGDEPALCDMLTIGEAFTGYAELFVDGIQEGTDIGNLTGDGSFAPDTLRMTNGKLAVYSNDSDIMVGKQPVMVMDGNTILWHGDSIQDAIDHCQGTENLLVLHRDHNETATVTKNINVDLGGYSWTAPLTVEKGATLYLKDSATDDYEGEYGKISQVTGTVKTMTGYRLYTEETGISAHAYSLRVAEAVLRPSTASMFFIGRFRGDDQFKESVYSYGIILDVTKEPSLSTLNKSSFHTSVRTGFEDNYGVTSLLLKNVLKDEHNLRNNLRNGDIVVYCRPFVRFQDNEFAFGEVRSLSFRQLLEKIDKKWTTEAVPEDLQELYRRFPDVLSQWDLPNLQAAVAGNAPSPYKVYDPTTVEEINVLPIATADMTPRELRQLCADFFRMQLTFQWISETDIAYDIRGRLCQLPAGVVYGGSPYSARSFSGNLYMTMEFCDQETGIMRNPGLTDQEFTRLIGNHCTYGPYWGWARVINSISAQFNVGMGIEKSGYIPLGDFTTGDLDTWTSDLDTGVLCQQMGEQAVYECYANSQLADCLYTFTEYVMETGKFNSHMRMVSYDPVVVRNEDGTINGDESYLLYMDQGGTWRDRDINGDIVRVEGGLDDKVTFKQLFEDNYLAFTFKEFLGLDPVEESVTTSTLDGLTTVTPAQLLEATVTSNYPISHITCSVTDETGAEVYRGNAFAPRIITYEMSLADAVDTEKLSKLSGQNLTVTCRISTGEVITLFDGVME